MKSEDLTTVDQLAELRKSGWFGESRVLAGIDRGSVKSICQVHAETTNRV